MNRQQGFDARRVYNRIGRLQDTQAFYERPALDVLIEHLDLAHARQVLEIGCGTGALARRLLSEELPEDAFYSATEVSDVMAKIARSRLAPFGDRVDVVLVEPDAPLPTLEHGPDRVIATYVFDLLDDADCTRLLRDVAHRIAPNGLAGFVALAAATDGLPGAIANGWTAVWRRFPRLVGGCRPIDLEAPIDRAGLEVTHAETVTAWGIASQVIVATPQANRQ